MNTFQVREKSRNFVDGQGNLEKTWKVREVLEPENKWLWQAENLVLLFKRGKDVLSHEIV